MESQKIIALHLSLKLDLLDLLNLVQTLVAQLLHFSSSLLWRRIRGKFSNVLVLKGVLELESCLLMDVLSELLLEHLKEC